MCKLLPHQVYTACMFTAAISHSFSFCSSSSQWSDAAGDQHLAQTQASVPSLFAVNLAPPALLCIDDCSQLLFISVMLMALCPYALLCSGPASACCECALMMTGSMTVLNTRQPISDGGQLLKSSMYRTNVWVVMLKMYKL